MRPRASTALVVKVSGVRANPESFKRYRDSGSSARAFRAGEDAPRELCRLTASSNDIALLEKERENEREREREKETERTRPRQRERERARSGNEGGFRRMQPLSIDNPRPHQRRYAITTTTFSSSTTTTTIITTTTVGHEHHLKLLPSAIPAEVAAAATAAAVVSWLFSQSIQVTSTPLSLSISLSSLSN